MNWILSANSKKYNHHKAFEDYGYIDWTQKYNIQINDIIYIYCTRPIKRIEFKCVVEKTNLSFSEIRDDKDYWLDLESYKNSLNRKYMRIKIIDQIRSDDLSFDFLKQNGLNGNLQGGQRVFGDLLQYIEKSFENENHLPEELTNSYTYFEGAKQKISINAYERNPLARRKCLEYYNFKYNCEICGFNFLDVYGDIGKDFIHVHHLKPLHLINEQYKIDPINDLLPVCPNCHAMLHRKNKKGKYLSVEKLKKILKN